MRVQINAGGREVVIECADVNMSPREIASEALGVWIATASVGPDAEGPAYGFQTERRNGQVQPLSPSRSFGLGWMHDPKATG